MDLDYLPPRPFFEQRDTVVAILAMLTLGFYQHYWHYRSWKSIQDNSGDERFSPLLRGVLFPLFIIPLTLVTRDSAVLHGINRGMVVLPFAIVYTFIALLSGDIKSVDGIIILMVNTAFLCLLNRKNRQVNQASAQQLKQSVTGDQKGSVIGNLSRGVRQANGPREDTSGGLQLRHRWTIEFSCTTVVAIACLAIALGNAQTFMAKAQLLDVFAFASVAKIEASTNYAHTGAWPETSLDYLSDNRGTRLIDNISSFNDGSIRFSLNDHAPFREGDYVDLSIDETAQTEPFFIHRWTCSIHLIQHDEEQRDHAAYSPSFCRG